MKHRAGDLRHQIRLQSRSAAQDGIGGQVDSWTDFATVYAEISPITGRELLSAQEVKNAVDTQIIMRYRPGMTASMRAIHGTTIYNIIAVMEEDSRREWMTLICQTGLSSEG